MTLKWKRNVKKREVEIKVGWYIIWRREKERKKQKDDLTEKRGGENRGRRSVNTITGQLY